MASTSGLDVSSPLHVASEIALEGMVSVVEAGRDRLQRAAAALKSAEVPYAIIGGNAVGLWVMEVDPTAARNTVDVDILRRLQMLLSRYSTRLTVSSDTCPSMAIRLSRFPAIMLDSALAITF